jgi:diguanylate cyclase (GGDEF)-like protein/PAS domain S-box-containing protein
MDDLTREEAIALYEQAPCGYVSTSLDGTILRVNETFANWIGRPKQDLMRSVNLQDTLTSASQIFYQTHYLPSLHMHGSVKDVALELLRANQASLPVLVTSITKSNSDGKDAYVTTTMFDGTERKRYEHDLLHSKRRADTLADVVRYSDTAIVTTTFDLMIETCNASAERLLDDQGGGLIVGSPLNSLLEPSHISVLNQALISNVPVKFELQLAQELLFEVKAYPTSGGLAVFFSNITEERKVQVALQEAHDRFNLATMATTDGLWDWDCVTGILYASARLQGMLGLSERAVTITIKQWFERVHPQDLNKVQDDLSKLSLIASQRFDSEYRVCHENGKWLWIHKRSLALYSPTGQLTRVIGSITDITSRKVEDSLTRLHSRLSLLERLDWRLATEHEHTFGCAVLFIDLDAFKRLNDGFGHASGDILLMEFARRMEFFLASDPGSIAARLGGDEFVLLLDDIQNEDDALARSDEIQKLLQRPVLCGDRQITLSASIGIALSRPNGGSAEDLLHNADLAMYRAKAKGKAQSVMFSESLRQQALERLHLEDGLRRAVRDNELVLYYQPKVLLATRTVIGFEALLRWKYGDRGLIPPDTFIRLAEESSLICDIGRWTVREAVRQLASWRSTGLVSAETRVAINLSPKQFGDSALIETLRRELEAAQLSPSCIELEVTEGVLIGDPEEALLVLQKLKALGVGLQLDDFGKGYSSLSYLHRYPFDALKIDRSFVNSLSEGGDGETITRTIIALGHTLGIDVIAEGIETEEQAYRLGTMGCLFGQGYLFSRPVPPPGIEELLKSSTRHI